jgi:large subunit ribosomal protein L5
MKNNYPRLKKKYKEEVLPTLKKEFEIKNNMAVPRVEKIVVNMGVGGPSRDKGYLDQAKDDLAAITGQMPAVRAAKVSVASFGIRRGMTVGIKSTLRGDRMYNFLDKLISVVLPRLRDFRGISLTSFDSQGNYSLGITEHYVFPDIDVTKSSPKSLEITIVTNTKNKERSERLFTLLGMPFEKEV